MRRADDGAAPGGPPVGIDTVLADAGIDAADVAASLEAVRTQVLDEVAEVRAEGDRAVPVVDHDQLIHASDATRERIRRRGCVVVRGTIERDEAQGWDAELGDYLASNGFAARLAARDPEAAARGSRIWGIYWSRPQVAARQHDRIAATRRALNSLWRHRSDEGVWFDPDHDIGYPDRIRRRAPGVQARGLGPHIDSPAATGWRAAENRAVFAPVLAGRPDGYDPFDATHRTGLVAGSPVGCSVFRTFQGWIALSETRPCDGGLSIVPIPAAAAYLVVAGVAAELGLDGEPRPAPRRAGGDPLLLPAMAPVPVVRPGDTVWWHGDLVHAVADAANRTRPSNVMYVGAAPRCSRNDAYTATVFERFVTGRSPVDFPAEDFEVSMSGRATPADLNDRGRQQLRVDRSDGAGPPPVA